MVRHVSDEGETRDVLASAKTLRAWRSEVSLKSRRGWDLLSEEDQAWLT